MNILLDEQFQKNTKQVSSPAPSQKNSQSLIRDAGAEKLMRRIEKIEIEEKECAIKKEEERFKSAFFSLAHKFFRIGESEMRELDEDELHTLWRMVMHRVKRRWRMFFAINGLFCAMLGTLVICVDVLFLFFSPLLVFNLPVLEEQFRHHFKFSLANKRIEKFTPDMIQ